MKKCLWWLLGHSFRAQSERNCRERWKSMFNSSRNRSPHGAYFVIRFRKQLAVARKRFLWAHPKREIPIPAHLFPRMRAICDRQLGGRSGIVPCAISGSGSVLRGLRPRDGSLGHLLLRRMTWTFPRSLDDEYGQFQAWFSKTRI